MVNLRKKYYQEVMPVHTRKISRLLNREADVDEHILTISSYELSFFQKLVLCRGLKFAIPQHVSSIEVKASFERAYWNLELHLNSDNSIELAAATLRSVALNYIQRRGPKPSKTLLAAIEQLKRRSDIVITKPDKGSGVVVMNKSENLRLLSEAFVNDTNKFRAVSLERPKSKGRPPKHYHPLTSHSSPAFTRPLSPRSMIRLHTEEYSSLLQTKAEAFVSSSLLLVNAFFSRAILDLISFSQDPSCVIRLPS